jgi:hypothetical protein
MPETTLNWNSATRRPRFAAGVISAIDIGPMTDDPPIASPPMNRKTTNDCQSHARAHPAAVTT